MCGEIPDAALSIYLFIYAPSFSLKEPKVAYIIRRPAVFKANSTGVEYTNIFKKDQTNNIL